MLISDGKPSTGRPDQRKHREERPVYGDYGTLVLPAFGEPESNILHCPPRLSELRAPAQNHQLAAILRGMAENQGLGRGG